MDLIGAKKTFTPPPVRDERCETCRAGHFATIREQGECRLDPPKMQFVMVQTAAGPQMSVQTAWPIVERTHFCITGFRPAVQH